MDEAAKKGRGREPRPDRESGTQGAWGASGATGGYRESREACARWPVFASCRPLKKEATGCPTGRTIVVAQKAMAAPEVREGAPPSADPDERGQVPPRAREVPKAYKLPRRASS